jgi:Protein of unknown function (DUF1697)
MADLREVVLGLGHTDVATCIQSGNVVFTSEESDTATIAAALERAIAEHLGVQPKVIVLTRGAGPGGCGQPLPRRARRVADQQRAQDQGSDDEARWPGPPCS